jgi:hypothetical protein
LLRELTGSGRSPSWWASSASLDWFQIGSRACSFAARSLLVSCSGSLGGESAVSVLL